MDPYPNRGYNNERFCLIVNLTRYLVDIFLLINGNGGHSCYKYGIEELMISYIDLNEKYYDNKI